MTIGTPRVFCKHCQKPRTGAHISYCADCYNAYKREWYKAHREREIARCAEYNKAHPEVPARNMRAVRERCGEAFKTRYLAYKAAHREEYLAYHSNKEARRRTVLAEGDGVSAAEWREMRATFKNCCAYCGANTALSKDHIIPLSRGGRHVISNIAPACRPCNSRKHARPLPVFLAILIQRNTLNDRD